MARLLYCRFDDCLEAYVSKEGKVPSVCPACQRSARWTTENPIERPSRQIPTCGNAATPPFSLTADDRRFLKVNRILDDWPTPDGGA